MRPFGKHNRLPLVAPLRLSDKKAQRAPSTSPKGGCEGQYMPRGLKGYDEAAEGGHNICQRAPLGQSSRCYCPSLLCLKASLPLRGKSNICPKGPFGQRAKRRGKRNERQYKVLPLCCCPSGAILASLPFGAKGLAPTKGGPKGLSCLWAESQRGVIYSLYRVSLIFDQ